MLQHSFRRFAATVAFSLPAVLLSANSALADQRDFTVHNYTSQDIYYLYVSSSDSGAWGEDVLGENTVLSSGDSVFVYFDNSSSSCFYDVKAIAEDGSEVEDYQVNLCEITDYYIQ